MRYGYDNPDDWDTYKYEHLRRIRNSAKVRKLKFNLTIEDFVYPDVCPVLDIPLTRKLGRDNHPCLDRVDNTKGYLKGNVRIISFKANLLKQKNSVETLERLIKYIKSVGVCNTPISL